MNFEKMVNITRAPSEECTDETDSQMRGITNGRDTPQILQAEEKNNKNYHEPVGKAELGNGRPMTRENRACRRGSELCESAAPKREFKLRFVTRSRN